MKAKDLKNAILQMAVQGTLVPQDLSDEPASVLLERIREKRAELIREKKIKAPKGGESVIYRAEDGSYYEKRVDAKDRESEPVCIDNEIPFVIPKTWEWVRVSSIGELIRGSGIKLTEITKEGLPCVRYGELYTTYDQAINKVSSHISPELFDRSQHAAKGDLLMTLTGENKIDIGRAVSNESGRAIAYGGDLIALKAHSQDSAFLAMCINSPYVGSQRTTLATGNIIVHLSGEKIGKLLVALPPLAEQHRIAKRVAELMPLVEEYGKLETVREKLDAELPDKLHKSILQMAVQGALVPQDHSDEPASALLKRIRKERAELITEKKIKAPKDGESIIYRTEDGSYYEKRIDTKGRESEPICIDDEIPFEIPKSWEWVRLGCLFDLQAGKNISASEIVEVPSKSKAIPCFGGNGIRGYVSEPNRFESHQIIGRQGALCGCVNFAAGPFYATEHAVVVTCFGGIKNDWAGLLLKCLNLNQYATSTAQPGLAVSKISKILVPLPPLKEQYRIANKTTQLIPLIESFSKLDSEYS